MTDAIADNKKKKGRPPVGSTFIGVRMPPDQLAALDAWIAEQPNRVSRPEAIRVLVATATDIRRFAGGTASAPEDSIW